MSLSLIPYELLCHILREAIDVHPTPNAIPRVNSLWHDISLPLLHSNIKLLSYERLRLFSAFEGDGVDCSHSMNTSRLLCYSPRGRNVEIKLPGGTPSAGVWKMIMAALRRCQQQQHPTLNDDGNQEERTEDSELGYPSCSYKGVRSLKLCMNSHVSDPDLHLIVPALSQINPEFFEWSGPDPDHHFSVAIVPTATAYICEAIRYWSRLRALNLSNISFQNHGSDLVDALSFVLPRGNPIILIDRSDWLSTDKEEEAYFDLTIKQAVHMHPMWISSLVTANVLIRSIELVDVYQESIWGPRLRLQDVEQSLMSILIYLDMQMPMIERTRSIVRCSAKTERLMGGDREVSQLDAIP